MKTKNADRPIQPLIGSVGLYLADEGDIGEPGYYCTGLSKREYFAGLAMQGILANQWSMAHGNYTVEEKAKMAVEYADALLAELEK